MPKYYIHGEQGDYRKADRIMEVLFKMRVAQLRKKKKNKSKSRTKDILQSGVKRKPK